MRSLCVLTAALGSCFVIAGCAQPAPAPPPRPDLAAEEKALREMDARWLKAAQARDAGAEAAVLAADGVAYREHNEPIVGPAAYQVFEAKLYADNPKMTIEWSTSAVQVAEAGDVAVQTGEFRYTGLGPKGDGEDKGRFVTVWKKTGGEWKVAYDIGSTTMPEVPAQKK